MAEPNSDAAVEEYRKAVRLVGSVSNSIPIDIAKVGYRSERNMAVASLVSALYERYRASPRPELLTEMLSAVEEGKSRALTEMVYSARGAPPDAFDLKALMAILPSDTNLIEYYAPRGASDQVLRFVVDHSGTTVDLLALSAQELEAEVGAMKDEAIHTAESYDEVGFRRHAAALGSILLPPVLRISPSAARRVYVVPTGVLYLFPFALLADEQGRFLAEREGLEVAYLPNAALALRQAPRLADANRMIAYVNPAREHELSGVLTDRTDSKGEIARALQGWKLTMHWGDPVTLQSLRDEVSQADNVFFFAHGTFIPEDPTRSYIRLANDSGRPTVLSAGELLQLRIGNGLWVLGACSSGSGEVRSGDEVLGLPRAMLQAGASMVVVSLWDVGQVPNWELMNAVFRRISGGMSVARALREAQSERRLAGRPPWDWAAFVLMGQHDYGR